MGIVRALRDPLYSIPVAALICAAITAASFLLFSSEGSADVSNVPPQATVSAAAPTATRAAATATAQPSYGDVLADTQRLLELAKVRDALEAFLDERGSYPTTNGAFSTLCETPSEAGCQLLSIDPSIPEGYEDELFWYQSDGATYTLFARVAVAPAASGCPDEVPPALEGGHVSCIRGGQ
jgi:hypothetical protein